jgi:hypothetical protein
MIDSFRGSHFDSGAGQHLDDPNQLGNRSGLHLVHHLAAVDPGGNVANANRPGGLLVRLTGSSQCHYLALARHGRRRWALLFSPWRYDVATAEAIRPDNLRRTAILRYASWAAVFRMSRVVRLPFDGSSHFDQSRVRPDGPFQASQSHNRNRAIGFGPW